MTTAFELSAVVDRLAGPAGWKLSLALAHFVWQGVLIAAVAAALMRLAGRRSARRRYAIGVAGIVLMAAAPAATVCLVSPPEPSAVAPRPPLGEAALLAEVDRLDAMIAALDTDSDEAPIASPEAVPATPPAPTPLPLTWTERARLWQPYGLLIWLAGATLFALRLGVGVRAGRRLTRERRSLPEAWAQVAIEAALRLGLKRPRVFVSDHVAEAVALGLLRPLVLLPAAWLGHVPPELLEAVLAHEFAHLRRHDLWVNLLQRCVESALFYHPAVWWLSRRVRVEREYCCDETAALAVSGRAAYARALEFAATEAVWGRAAAATRPAPTALAAGMGGDSMALLDRVKRVLGTESRPPRGSWASEGLLALAVPAALWAAAVAIGPSIAEAGDDEADDLEATAAEEPADHDADDLLENILIPRPEHDQDRDVLIPRDGEAGSKEPIRIPFLHDLPYVGRLFKTGVDADADDQPDILIARSHSEDTADEDQADPQITIRKLQAELQAARAELSAIKSRDGAAVTDDTLDDARRDRDAALVAWRKAEPAEEPRARNRYYAARRRFDEALRRLLKQHPDLQLRSVPLDTASEAAIEALLNKRVSLNEDNVALKDLIQKLWFATGVGMVLDASAVSEVGLTADSPVSVHVQDIPADKAIKLILGPLSLGYYLDGEQLKITTAERAQRQLTIRAYQVADIVEKWEPKSEGQSTLTTAPMRRLAEVIVKHLRPETWEMVGGPGVIRTNETTLSLVVRQSRDVHEEIADLLMQFRRLIDARAVGFTPGGSDPPIRPGALRIETKEVEEGQPRYIVRRAWPPDAAERFEVRIFKKDGDLAGQPENVIKHLNVEKVDGVPRVVLYQEWSDSLRPDRVVGKPRDGGETVIETDAGRIHVRPLPPGKPEGATAEAKRPAPHPKGAAAPEQEPQKPQTANPNDREAPSGNGGPRKKPIAEPPAGKAPPSSETTDELRNDIERRLDEIRNELKQLDGLKGQPPAAVTDGEQDQTRSDAKGTDDRRSDGQVVSLKYIPAELLAAWINEAYRDRRTKAVADDRTNSVIIFGQPAEVAAIVAKTASLEAEKGKAIEKQAQEAIRSLEGLGLPSDKLDPIKTAVQARVEAAQLAARKAEREADEAAEQEVTRLLPAYYQLLREKRFGEAAALAERARQIAPSSRSAAAMAAMSEERLKQSEHDGQAKDEPRPAGESNLDFGSRTHKADPFGSERSEAIDRDLRAKLDAVRAEADEARRRAAEAEAQTQDLRRQIEALRREADLAAERAKNETTRPEDAAEAEQAGAAEKAAEVEEADEAAEVEGKAEADEAAEEAEETDAKSPAESEVDAQGKKTSAKPHTPAERLRRVQVTA